MEYRVEKDSKGEIKVAADRLWGAQTQRSLENFRIGTEKMPHEIISAFAQLKKAAASANHLLGRISTEQNNAIASVCDEILSGKHDGEFPLAVWQTGSGTQTNMNVNEVIANRGNALSGKNLLHPNDTVNRSQSSNDTFPSAMRIAAVTAVRDKLLPAISRLTGELLRLENENIDVIKVGRTHLQDAVPLRFSQEISGWRSMVQTAAEMIEKAMVPLSALAIGGTAVGTGLNAPEGFDIAAVSAVSALTGIRFSASDNKFRSLTSLDDIVFAHGAIKALAADMMKIANDVRWLSSGPRCGLGEIRIPENEPGSSIMPGKVNPTQCEAVTMVAVQVIANDTAVSLAASQGNFELNVFLPVTAYNFLQSVNILSDSIVSFCKNCLSGLCANREKMLQNLDNSLMNVTALNNVIGYDKAAEVAKTAYSRNISLAEAVQSLGYMTESEAKAALDPSKMVKGN